MRILDAAATRAALPFDRLIAALRDAFAAGCHVPARSVHAIADPASKAVLTSLVMPAWTEGGHYGVKIVNVAPGNAALGLPGLHATYVLHDARTGVPVAIVDGGEITARRTVAASALAASFLARRDARRLLVVGAGRIAGLLPQAHREVRSIEAVTVWARRRDAADALAAAWRATGIAATSTGDLASACAEADIVSCATLSTEALVRGRWLRPGTHLDLIGGFTPRMREADDDCFRDAGVYVDTDEALHKSGDLLGPMSRGVLVREDVRATLAQIVRGDVAGRRDERERTVFKSVGTALEDLAAAVLALERGVRSPA